MMTVKPPIVIVGAGMAGYQFVINYRQSGGNAALLMITEDAGDYYTKPQLSSALSANKTPQALRLYSSEQMAKKYNVQIISKCKALAIDTVRQQLLTSLGEFSYQRLVLAYGAQPRPWLLNGKAVLGAQAVNHLDDYTAVQQYLMPESQEVLIVGAGLVGVELANDWLKKGHHVHLFHDANTPINTWLPEKIGHALQQALIGLGLRWHNIADLESIQFNPTCVEVCLANQQTLEVAMVVRALGLAPKTALAKTANLSVSQGLVVNEFLQTSESNIYAIGDCVEYAGQCLRYIAPLRHQAQALARTLAGEPTALVYPMMPIMVKTPVMPIMACLPKLGIQADWCVEGRGLNWTALAYDQHNQLQGFILTGDARQEKLTYLKALQD